MESTSHDSDEVTILINKVESLNKRLDKMEDLFKKNNDCLLANTASNQSLRLTIIETNKVFEQVSDGVKEIYDKIRGFELLSKLAGNINIGSILGGLGSAAGGSKK